MAPTAPEPTTDPDSNEGIRTAVPAATILLARTTHTFLPPQRTTTP
jgi:hypothetical protein